MRIRLPAVKHGDLIQEAALEVYFDSTNEDSPETDIHIQLDANPAQFGPGPGDIAARPRSVELVHWSGLHLGEGWHRSPPVTVLVQRAIDDMNWMEGNPIVFIFDELPSANLVELRQYDYPPAGSFAARLFVTYVPR